MRRTWLSLKPEPQSLNKYEGRILVNSLLTAKPSMSVQVLRTQQQIDDELLFGVEQQHVCSKGNGAAYTTDGQTLEDLTCKNKLKDPPKGNQLKKNSG